MIPELGQLALALALAVALVQGILPLAGAARGDAVWMAVARPAAHAQALLITFSFGCLVYAFVANDFSVQYVASHSNTGCRCSTASPAPGAATKARCCCGA